MIPENRRREIQKRINDDSIISLSDLAIAFNVSVMTIRRDVKLLRDKNLIEKVYGGIAKLDYISEIHYLKQLNKMVKEKNKIAIESVKKINDNSTVLLQGGTTCYQIAKNIASKKNLTIISCAPPIIEYFWKLYLGGRDDYKVYCPGGALQFNSNFFTGDHAEFFFKNIVIDIAFIGVIGINCNDGFMVTTEEEKRLLISIVKSSKKVIVPVDHTKFFKSALIKVGLLNSIDEIITDKKLDQKIYKEFLNINIKVTLV